MNGQQAVCTLDLRAIFFLVRFLQSFSTKDTTSAASSVPGGTGGIQGRSLPLRNVCSIGNPKM